MKWSFPRIEAEMRKHTGSFDFIIDAVSADHDLNAYLQLLKLDGTMTWWARQPTRAGCGIQSDHQTPASGRLGHWRSSRNAGDAWILRRGMESCRISS